jgi:hypothetical protein
MIRIKTIRIGVAKERKTFHKGTAYRYEGIKISHRHGETKIFVYDDESVQKTNDTNEPNCVRAQLKVGYEPD